MKKQEMCHKYQTLGMSTGMCLGMAQGMSFGMLYGDNGTIGMCIGLSIGMMVGMLIGMGKDSAINKQIQEKGYTIQVITQKADSSKEYEVELVDKNGEITTVIVGKGDMEVEGFAVGDLVFMDEEGDIEQALDKEDE